MIDVRDELLGDTSTPEALARTVTAERACWETYLEYFDVIDKKRPHHLAAECFTKDATVTYGMKGAPLVFTGRDEYAAFLDGAVVQHEMIAHVVGQHRFTWRDGVPRLITYVTSWQWFTANAGLGENRPADYATIGYAEDDFRFEEGKWLIFKRFVAPAAGATALGGRPAA